MTVSELALAHVNNELHHLEDRLDVPLDKVNSVLAKVGAQLQQDLGKVNYAGTCPIREHTGAHLVVAGVRGPVTLLFMPGEQLDQRQVLQDQRFSGVVLPTANGSIAIVGERGEPLERLERRLRDSVEFPAST